MSAARLLGVALFVLAFSAFAQRSAEYVLGPGDSIRVSVFENPNLTLETRISDDGTINYPLLGSVRIGGMTIARAEQTIARALDQGNLIKRPQVSIQSLQSRSSQVSVLGQVNRPGRFPLETLNTRLSEVIAIAGGISAAGADVATISGERGGKPYRQEVDIVALFLKKRGDEDVTVAAGDVIYVHRAPMFYIYGEVQKPGSYRIEREMTLRQALVQGGGPTSKGTERGLRLFRRGADSQVQVISPKLSDPVQPDDVLHVGESIF